MIFTAVTKKFAVANQIKELVEMSPNGHAIMLRNDFCRGTITNNELYSIMMKLATDHKVIRIAKAPEYSLAMSNAARYSLEFYIEILPPFGKFYKELREEARKKKLEEEEMDDLKNQEQTKDLALKTALTRMMEMNEEIKELKSGKNENIGIKSDGCWISYSENSREILLNDLFLISKPDFESENDQVFYYLYRNPNKTITKVEVQENFTGNKTLTKDFNKIVENLKFKKDLRRAFFDISQDSIKFYNPVSQKRLQELGIKNIPIEIK